MLGNPTNRKRVPQADDSDIEDEYEPQVQQRIMDDLRKKQQEDLQMLDLGTRRMDKIKSDDRKVKKEDLVHERKLLASRKVNQAGTEEFALWNKNKVAVAAWSSKSVV